MAKGELPPVRHEDVRPLVSRAWDGALSADEAKGLAAHLRACPECAEAAKKFIDFLSRLEPYLDDLE